MNIIGQIDNIIQTLGTIKNTISGANPIIKKGRKFTLRRNSVDDDDTQLLQQPEPQQPVVLETSSKDIKTTIDEPLNVKDHYDVIGETTKGRFKVKTIALKNNKINMNAGKKNTRKKRIRKNIKTNFSYRTNK